MAINLPTLPLGTNTEIKIRSNAVDHKPYLGGPTQRLSRLGDRWNVKVDCRPMHTAQAGAVVAALVQGLSDTVIYRVPQPGLNTAQWSDGQVDGAVSGGRIIDHTGGGAPKQVGQYISIIVDGTRYLHMVTAVSGQTLTIFPSLKVSLGGLETIEFGAPKIQGFLSGNEQSWTIGLAENLGVSFEIEEAQ